MEDWKLGLGPLQDSEPQVDTTELARESKSKSQEVEAERKRIRAARARLIEQTTYCLTDLFTILCGRIDILSEKVPLPWREELLALRADVKKGVELNKRFFFAAQACQRELEEQK